jgi:hypothetical protein
MPRAFGTNLKLKQCEIRTSVRSDLTVTVWKHKQNENMKSTIFWDITMCSPLKASQRFGGTYRHHLQGWICWARHGLPPAFTLVSCSVDSTLKTKVMYSSKTLANFHRTTWCYIPENSNLHNHHCENLKSYKMKTCCWARKHSETSHSTRL